VHSAAFVGTELAKEGEIHHAIGLLAEAVLVVDAALHDMHRNAWDDETRLPGHACSTAVVRVR
jgi:hypothetical protein